MSIVIETRDLTKRYGQVVAVEGLNLVIRQGEVFGLLGPNGSGKTTTILMLLGLTEPSAGEVRVLGFDPVRQPLEVKRRVGYLPESVGFYDELTARENLRYIAHLNGIYGQEATARIREVLTRMGLWEVADRPVGTYSRGMRQRLGLAEVLLKRPQLAILDEPTAGLDPHAALEFLDLVRGLKADGITVLLSSHLLHQVQAICDRVGLFYRGRMVLEGTVEELSRRVLDVAYRIRLEAAGDGLEEALSQVPDVVKVTREHPHLYLLDARSDCRDEVARQVVAGGGKLLSLTLEQLSLDEVYNRYFQEVRHEA
ncbi:MAG: ABC transporter ATP-binding protein [Armatimonadota bacterium]|nr:ABC transporter ATP-binding protein [Armatimonadota bacterium]MDR5704112.1 ABC transporter ATP-binding protein [Armatimonadota bacterium]MDR7435415.1 ABC transporter ATP-binding protein [Armatimonadota bacterium]